MQNAWASYDVIDVHAHIGTFTGYDLSLQTLLRELQEHNVRLALISNIDGAQISATKNLDEKSANEQTAKIVNQYPKLFRGLVWTRPEDGSVQHVEQFLKDYRQLESKSDTHQPIFVGMKFHPEFNSFAADDRRVDPYLSLCAKYGVPAVFHCGESGSNSGPERIYAVARRHPNVPIVLYHMGFGSDHKSAIDVVRQSKSKKDALLYLETSQSDAASVIDAIKTVGAERLLFGTDATYFGSGHYKHYEELVERLHRELKTGDFNLVMHGNATRLFKL